MRHIINVLVLMFSFYGMYAQSLSIEGWDQDQINKANTAKDANYLSDNEKLVILYCNLARMDGKKFVEVFLKPRFKGEINKASNIGTLYADLQSQQELPPFITHEKLSKIANSHALEMGKSGKTGHDGFSSRYSSVDDEFMTTGENCSYGLSDPLAVVIDLLVDEGVPSLGHRKNILSSSFRYLGVGMRKHKIYQINTVMSFGGL